MNLTQYLNSCGKTIDDIIKIYHGLDHWCRCGCGGNYFERGSRGFTRALNKILRPDFEPLQVGTMVHTKDGRNLKSDGVECERFYINIPYNCDTDKCYCLYFERNIDQ